MRKRANVKLLKRRGGRWVSKMDKVGAPKKANNPS